jgi:hypothetical protein
MVFAGAPFETEAFPWIQEEAEARGVPTDDPARFLLLSQVGRLLRELLPEGAGGGEAERYGMLIFQAYHFWRYGQRVHALDEARAREAVEHTAPLGKWAMVPPAPAGYLQLPRHLFWARVEEGATPEPVDGFFWTLVGEADPARPPYRRLDVLLVLGMYPGRPGFSTIAVGGELEGAPEGHWGDVQGRLEGADFANILPGGELQGWHGLVTEPEVLKLVSRIFRELEREGA